MDIPKLPTDNFYKFLTIAGLVLVGSSVIWFQGERREAFDKADSARLQAKILEIEKEHLEKELASLSNQEEARLEKEKQIEIKTAQVASQVEIANRVISKAEVSRLIFIVVVCLGVAIAAAGLKLWYERLQVYQDRLVKNQAKGK